MPWTLAAILMIVLPMPAGALPIEPIAPVDGLPEPVDIPPLPTQRPPNTPCDKVAAWTTTQGGVDNFVGLQPRSPRAGLSAVFGALPQRHFDDGGNNEHFIHTIAGLPQQILSAQVTMRLRPETSALSANDFVHIGYNPAQGGVLQSEALGPAWLFANGPQVLSWAASPAVVTDMNTFGWLDFYIQDDTAIDWIRLDIRYCECAVKEPFSVIQGTADDFASSGSDITTPRAAIGVADRQYDTGGADRTFRTTVPVPTDILTGTVQIRLRGVDALVTTDSISVGYNGLTWDVSQVSTWGNSATILTYTIPGDVARATVDNAGGVDVVIQDDTMVDWIWVNGTRCRCREYPPAEVLQGDVDRFGEVESADDIPTPQGAFAAWLQAPLRNYDEETRDKRFGTTLDLPCSCAKNATLEIHARPTDALAVNDGLALQFTGTTPAFLYSTTFTTLAGQPWSSATMGPSLFTVDLGSIPGMLASICARGSLDIYVQDDTDIDYVRLLLTY